QRGSVQCFAPVALTQDPAFVDAVRQDVLANLVGDRGPLLLCGWITADLGQRLYERPEAPRQPLAAARMQQNRVECGTEDIVLPLIEGAVADAHRPCS